MKKILLGVLAVSLIIGVLFIFMNDNETQQHEVKAENSTEDEIINETESKFVEEVSEKLKSKGYKSTGLITSEDFGKKVRYLVHISENENKGKVTQKDIKQTFKKIAESYELKPFTVQLWEK